MKRYAPVREDVVDGIPVTIAIVKGTASAILVHTDDDPGDEDERER